MTDYAVYKGDEFLVAGTDQECADFMGWQQKKTTNYYSTPAYMRKVAKRKNARNYITVVKLEEEEE